MTEKKTDIVRRLVSDGNYKKALGIVKGFHLGITREESAKMTRAYECMVRPGFYGQIVKNPSDAIDEGIRILRSLYGAAKNERSGHR
jgi:hypothetical protein